MIARQRGEHAAHLRWRPQRPLARDDAPAAEELAGDETTDDGSAHWGEPIVDEELLVEDEPHLLEELPQRRARWPIVAVVLAIAFGAYALGSQPSSAPTTASTPRAWLRTYMGWSTRSPARVCAQLLTPTLARLFAQAHGSCEAAYRGVKSAPFSVLRVLRNGSTATIELHWLPNVGYSTIVLNRDAGGWRAVDMIPGGHVVPHR
jgi:hypothetical protein